MIARVSQIPDPGHAPDAALTHGLRGKQFNWRPDINPDRRFERTVAVARLHEDAFAVYRPNVGWEVMSAATWQQLYASPVPEFLSNLTWRWYRTLRHLDGSCESHAYANTDLVNMSASCDLAWRQAYLAGLIRQKTGLPRRIHDFGPEDRHPMLVKPRGMTQDEFYQAIFEDLTDFNPYAEVDVEAIPIRVRVEATAPLRACA